MYLKSKYYMRHLYTYVLIAISSWPFYGVISGNNHMWQNIATPSSILFICISFYLFLCLQNSSRSVFTLIFAGRWVIFSHSGVRKMIRICGCLIVKIDCISQYISQFWYVETYPFQYFVYDQYICFYILWQTCTQATFVLVVCFEVMRSGSACT